jgi:signal transduction histidine kinase
LPDGLILVVGTDTFDIATMRQRLLWFTLSSGVGISLFALFGGLLAGRHFTRRLERVNHTVDRIIDGNLDERIPAIGVGPEIDALIRNLNRMLERKAAAMEGLRQVSTAIAHDLRTPLMRLRQRLESLQDTKDPKPVLIDGAVGQIDDILTTFQALLRIGMMEGGVGRQRFGPVNLSDLMDRLVQLYEPVMEDADHRFEANHAAGVFVEGDEDLLIQLFTNLIENAIVHTPAGTTISSTLSVQGLHAIMNISDDGPGVPDSERDKIFRKFYRHDTSRNTPGSGLGLSLVAAIADLHNASYRAASTGKGFALEITFQRSKGHHRPAGEG